MHFSEILSAFVVENDSTALEKLKRLQERGASGLHIVFDFDRTMTAANAVGENITSWHLISAHLPPSLKEENEAMAEVYRLKEMDRTMTPEEAVFWWGAAFDRFQKAGLNMLAIEKEFVERATVRPGTKEVFTLCQQLGIPTTILSAGIQDIIEMWCRHFEVHPTQIISNKLSLAPDGTMLGWDSTRMVHVLNKKEQAQGDMAEVRLKRPFTIVVGDSLDDASMAEGEDEVLRIRIYNPRPDERENRAEVLRETFALFDLLIEEETFNPLLNLINALSTAQSQ